MNYCQLIYSASKTVRIIRTCDGISIDVFLQDIIPSGPTSERPTNPVEGPGSLRYNTDTKSFEYYDGTAWVVLGGGATIVPTFADLPPVGKQGAFYITEDDNTLYYWNNGYIALTGTGAFIVNQNAAPQGANFWIGGSAAVGPFNDPQSGRFVLSGSQGEFLLLDRGNTSFPNGATTGQMWSTYSENNTYIIDSNGEQFKIFPTGNIRLGPGVDNGAELQLTNGVLSLAAATTDFPVLNGGMFYRSDTNKYRICEAGVWKDIATADSIAGKFIDNQYIAPQSGEFWIGGRGRVDNGMIVNAPEGVRTLTINSSVANEHAGPNIRFTTSAGAVESAAIHVRVGQAYASPTLRFSALGTEAFYIDSGGKSYFQGPIVAFNSAANVGGQNNGEIFYNTSVHKFQVVSNATWKYLATEDSIVGKFIENQTAVVQSASFNINGSGYIGSKLTVSNPAGGQPAFDIIDPANGLVSTRFLVDGRSAVLGLSIGMDPSQAHTNVFPLEIFGNTPGSNPKSTSGFAFGWNRSGGGGESNLFWCSNAGSSRHFELGHWDGATYASKVTVAQNGTMTVNGAVIAGQGRFVGNGVPGVTVAATSAGVGSFIEFQTATKSQAYLIFAGSDASGNFLLQHTASGTNYSFAPGVFSFSGQDASGARAIIDRLWIGKGNAGNPYTGDEAIYIYDQQMDKYRLCIQKNGNWVIGTTGNFDNGCGVQIYNGALSLFSDVTDKSIVNGALMYRSDTHKLRAAINGQWQNVATEITAGYTTSRTILVDNTHPSATDNRTGLSKYNQSFPFLTIQAGLNAWSTGDTVKVINGQYGGNCTLGPYNGHLRMIYENATHQVSSGTALSLYAKDGGGLQMFMRGSYIYGGGNAGDVANTPAVRLNSEGSATILLEGDNLSAIQGFDGAGVMAQTVSNIDVRKMTIRSTNYYGFISTNYPSYLRDCTIVSDNSTGCYYCFLIRCYVVGKVDGLQLLGNTRPSHCQVQDSYVEGTTGTAIIGGSTGGPDNGIGGMVKNSTLKGAVEAFHMGAGGAFDHKLYFENVIAEVTGAGTNAFFVPQVGDGTSVVDYYRVRSNKTILAAGISYPQNDIENVINASTKAKYIV